MFIAIGGPQAHVTLSMTDTLLQQPASLVLSDKNSRNYGLYQARLQAAFRRAATQCPR